ncbi:hypothetical protein [Rhodococcus wratislaviensis]|uniref:hypothetical protein n=1 Tax=Rhodococcus wratislaviensis TaxID=44752 RepID=UPI003667FD4E
MLLQVREIPVLDGGRGGVAALVQLGAQTSCQLPHRGSGIEYRSDQTESGTLLDKRQLLRQRGIL